MVIRKFYFCCLLIELGLSRRVPYPYGFQSLNFQQKQQLNAWNSYKEENIWELSGQYEGDMLLVPSQTKGVINKRMWPNGVVPYEVDEKFFNGSRRVFIDTTLAKVAQVTCIKPINRTTERDYVFISGEKDGCWSYVGKIGKAQRLNLGKGCFHLGIIIHEFLHALGFEHQHSYAERDDYVSIIFENIKNESVRNFHKRNTTNYGEPYDYTSIMHYSKKAFSTNGKDTIVPKKSGVKIGQRAGLSQSDTNKINKMYQCEDYLNKNSNN